jgi:membrane protein DedA with SNARE-associated domain
LTSVPPSLTLSPAMSHHEADKPLEQENDIATVDKTDEEQPAEPKAGVKRKGQLKYLLLLAAALLAVILVTVLVQKPTNFDEYIKSSGYIGVFLMALIGSASPIWPLPGSWAVFIAAGLGLNPIILGLLGGLGEPIGELTGYTAGFGGQVALQKFKRYKQIEGWMKRWGGPTIFVVSAIPNVFIKAATIAAGGLRYPIWKFFLFCWAGKTVKSLAFAFAGYGLFDGIKHLIDRIF